MNFEVDGPVATIRFTRPETHNRIQPADLDELQSHLRGIEERPEIRVLILASTGKTFSAGFTWAPSARARRSGSKRRPMPWKPAGFPPSPRCKAMFTGAPRTWPWLAISALAWKRWS